MTAFDFESLRPGLEAAAGRLTLSLTSRQADTLLAYLALLQRWNATYNLTAIRDLAAMLVQHVVDCLAVVEPVRRHAAGRALRLLDVGSGGGLPGIVIATLCSDIEVSCIDAVGKKAAFVVQAAAELGLTNLRGVHGRVESVTNGGYDLITSRAFASLNDFIRLSEPALADQGAWMAMKGRPPVDELNALPPSIDVFHVEQLLVPGLNADRCLVWMRRSEASLPASL